ncbi:MAG: hypothetical protein M5R36_21880 [Deltaproteobacteria bacterium]|nr:hypothetical protein [Deltaproteobacteria bacterium]
MIRPCPQCSRAVDVTAPGYVMCPDCGTAFDIPADEFEWTEGEHLDDSASPYTGATPTIPVAEKVAETPRCEICHARPAVRACSSCGRLVCAEDSPNFGAGRTRCVDCTSGVRGETPENFWAALWPTIREVALRPSRFFENLPVPGPLWTAVFFGVLVAIPGSIIEYVSNLALQPEIVDALGEYFPLPDNYRDLFRIIFRNGGDSGGHYFFFRFLFLSACSCTARSRTSF